MGAHNEGEYLGWLSWITHALVVACIWVLVALVVMAFLWVWPTTPLGWILAIVFGPVIFLLHEAVGELYWSGLNRVPFIREMRNRVEEETKDQRVSGERIAYVLIEIIIFGILLTVIGFAVYKASGDSLSPIMDFFRENYE